MSAYARNPHLIIIAIGINDSSYRKSPDNPVTSIAQFEINVTKLVQQSVEIVGIDRTLIVGLVKGDDTKTVPLPRSTTGKCYTKEHATRCNEVLKRVCHENKVPFVDLIDKLDDDDFDDGLHPNLRKHKKIYEHVRSEISQMLV